ncbi:MAG: NAD-dependent epimerase/dehydratase family protein [Planctomycetota bacterium]
MKILIVGCGYVGSEVVRQAPTDAEITVLTRSRDRFEELRDLGVEPVFGHWLSLSGLSSEGDSPSPNSPDRSLDSASGSDSESESNWAIHPPEVDAILVAVPHREDNAAGEQTHVLGLQNLERAYLHAAQRDSKRQSLPPLIYLSTTGVYGQADDCVVTEETPVSPTRIGPRIAVAAEQWLQQNSNWTTRVLRLAGIYGPDRVPLAAKLRSGEPLTVPQDGYLNLVHVADIAAVIWQLIQAPTSETTYVLSDANPVLRKDFYHYLASLCDVDEPVFEAPDPTSTRARRAGNKRVNPERIFRDLELELRYPDYQCGLSQALGS